MWTSRNCARYDRSKLRYPSDVTDEEWELMVPLIPPGKSGGGKRTVIMREVVERSYVRSVDRLSVARNPERPAPKARSTTILICGPMTAHCSASTTRFMTSVVNKRNGKPSPTAAIIDSQSVKSAEKGGPASMRWVTTQARKSRARSGMFSSIH